MIRKCREKLWLPISDEFEETHCVFNPIIQKVSSRKSDAKGNIHNYDVPLIYLVSVVPR